MDSAEYATSVAARLTADGFEVSRVDLPAGHAVVGYRSEFRLRWMATKLHALVVVVPLPEVTAEAVGVVTEQAVDYAKRTKGQLRGLQTGVAALPVLVSSRVHEDAVAAVEARPSKHWAAFVLPTVVDLGAGAVHRYDGRLVWGGVYSAWIRERLDALPPPTAAR
jgi:hypothetical protein